MELSVIIPCYNEERRIGKTLERVSEYLDTQPFESEVIVVDNGSIDNTGLIVESFRDIIPHLTYISRRSHGKGYAIREGMLRAQGAFLLMTDADNSTDIAHVESLLAEARKGADVIISSRKVDGARIENQRFFRRVTSAVFSKLVQTMIPLGIEDTQNGFKLFSRKAANLVFPHQTDFYWVFDVEILAIAKKFGLTIVEVPVTYSNNNDSTMSIRSMFRMLLEIMIIRINLWTHHYVKNERRRGGDRRAEARGDGDRRATSTDKGEMTYPTKHHRQYKETGGRR